MIDSGRPSVFDQNYVHLAVTVRAGHPTLNRNSSDPVRVDDFDEKRPNTGSPEQLMPDMALNDLTSCQALLYS